MDPYRCRRRWLGSTRRPTSGSSPRAPTAAAPHGRAVSLDGIHATIVGYGLLVRELITVMERAGVVLRHADGTVRPGPVQVDVERLIRRDTLISRAPGYVMSGLERVRRGAALLSSLPF